MKIIPANRILNLPPFLFVEFDRRKKGIIEKGGKLINFGVGDPDLPPSDKIINHFKQSLDNQSLHRYPTNEGLIDFRIAVANWYKRRFNVDLNYEDEVILLIGAKEGIGHFPLAVLNPDEVGLVTQPGYPVYAHSIIFAGGLPYYLPINEENNYLPDFDSIPDSIKNKTRLIFLNYPNNPTSATATEEFFDKVVHFAKKYNAYVCHDACYTEVNFDGFKPISFLNIPGDKDVGVEIHSLSKTFNMCGWRIGFAVGNKHLIKYLWDIKANLDSGQFEAIQDTAVFALSGNVDDDVKKTMDIYSERRNILVENLINFGFKLNIPKATFYVWAKIPQSFKTNEKSISFAFSNFLLEKAHIVTIPGAGFGPDGEGFVRFSLTLDKEKIYEGIKRMEKLF